MILIVDDERANRFMLRLLLEEAGHDVSEASGGHQALQLCDDAIDAVVLDFRMPDMDGVEVAEHLRAAGFTRPIVLYSAYFAPALQERLDAASLDVRLVDKSDHDALIAALATVVPATH